MKDHLSSAVLLFCLSAFICTAPPASAQTTAPNQWTWLGGSQTVTNANGQPGVYGILGTPAQSNIPGGRDGAATWTDSSGNFWLFGGEGADANGNFGQLNDVWEFQPTTQKWTWMGGSSTLPTSCASSTTVACGQPGIYGNLGYPAAANTPGGRDSAATWTDSSGNFWLFGGYGFDANGTLGELSDLWEFDPATKQWTWMGGSDTISSNGGDPGVYGVLGSADGTNIPGGRDSATSWTDKSGNFWLYGGKGFDGQDNYGHLDDLWEFSPTTKEWTWISGSSTLPAVCEATAANSGLCGWPAVYGALGISAAGIGPGSRVGASGWTDKYGNLWLFGGLGTAFWEQRDFSEIDQYDLWEFDTSTRLWVWNGGNSTSICSESTSDLWCGQDGNYGTLGSPSIANIPPSRNNATAWTDTSGNLWLFGGAQSETTNSSGASICNDVWVFEPAANEWAWMNGTGQDTIGYSCSFAEGLFGVLGTPAAADAPSGRAGAASWTDSSGNLWLFGGVGFNRGQIYDLNDLWIYQPVSPAPEPSFELIASPNPINIPAMGTGAPAITTATTTVNIIAADGFDSPVTLTAATDTMNGVTDITGSFSPATITGSGSSMLTISVTGSAVLVPESIPLTITATSSGVSQSIQVIVEVTSVGQIAAPTFSVAAGTYSSPQTITISAPTNQFIYYTVDGTTPTASSAVYVNPITVASTTTLKAILIDPFYEQSAVSSATYNFVPAQPNFSIAGTAISVAPGATTGNTSTVTLTPSGGFTGVINLSCAITPTASNDPATCSVPTSATISGSTAQTVTLTVNTTAATSALNQNSGFFWPSVSGAALGCILLLGFPARRRKRWSTFGMFALLVFAMGGILACGSGGVSSIGGGGGNGIGSGGSGGNPGTSAGTYVVTVTGTAGTITRTGTITLTVQ